MAGLTKYLIVAEKPELGNAVESAIHGAGSRIPKGEYRVVSALGHLLQLKAPEDYDPKYKQWRIEDLPIAFPHWEEVPLRTGKDRLDSAIRKRLDTIAKGLSWCDVAVNCGDPDDEGQYLVDQILEYLHNTKPVLRLLVNDNSPANIVRQVNRLEDNALYYKLGRGAYARTVADAMFGYNFTRYYSRTYNTKGPLSVGRVQTPTLGLVVARDEQIESHVKQKYYELSFTASTDGIQASFPMGFVFHKDNPALTEGRVLDKAAFAPIIAQVSGRDWDGGITKQIVKEQPPLPFNLAKLQAYCSTHYKMTPEQVQDATQRLRGKALITYNRSSCQYLHEEQHKEAATVMPIVFGNLGITAPVDYSIKSRCFNDKYTDGEPHHAIIPIATKYDAAKLPPDELNVYKAVCLYYILQFLPPHTKTKYTAEITLPDGNKLTATASKTIDFGFDAYLGKTKDTDVSDLCKLPAMNLTFHIDSPQIAEKETTPPKRYTQASLIEDMTSAAKYVTDPAVKKMLIEKDKDKQTEHGGIGTPATRAGIVETLIRRGYVKEVGSGRTAHIESTPLGRSFYHALPENIRGINTTSKWWAITRQIQRGEAEEDALYNSVLGEIREFLRNPPPRADVAGLTLSWSGRSGPGDGSGKGRSDGGNQREVIGKCPRCGRNVYESAKGFGCEGYKDNEHTCNFTIWKQHPLLAKSGKSVTARMARQLLNGGSCGSGTLKSKSGRSYSGVLRMEDGGPGGFVNLKFEFESDKNER